MKTKPNQVDEDFISSYIFFIENKSKLNRYTPNYGVHGCGTKHRLNYCVVLLHSEIWRKKLLLFDMLF